MRRGLWFYILVFISVTTMVVVWSHFSFKRNTRATYEHSVKSAPFDVVIVPGIPYNRQLSNNLLAVRLFWAKALFDRGFVKNIIFSGGAVHSAFVEGRVMQIMADSLGIPPGNVFCEPNARHSDENVAYGYKLAHQLGFKKIAVATDAYQAFFLKTFIEHKTPEIMQLPLAVDSIAGYVHPLPVIDAHEAREDNFVPYEQKETRWQRFKHAFPSN